MKIELTAVPPEIVEMIDAGVLFAVSHSGGKDSQAMMIRLRALVPLAQLVVNHAPLGAWKGPARWRISAPPRPACP